MPTFAKSSPMPASAERLWAFHVSPGALERLTPPWERVRIEDPGRGVAEGSRVVLRVGRFPFRLRWVAEHREVHPGREFTDVQIRGPFRRWEHVHRFVPDGDGASILEDRIRYELPGGRLGLWLGGPHVRRKLDRMFAWRHEATRRALEEGSSA